MSDVIIYDRMQERRGTAANLAAVNEVLRDGEICVETDTTWPNGGGRKFKIGPGAWNSLPYAVPDVGANGAMTLVGTATVTGSAATVLTMSGLDLATDKRYIIELAFKNATASQSSVSLYYNGDTTAANYDAQFMTIDGATTTPLRVGSGLVFSVPASSVINSEMKIRHDLDGRARALITSNRGDATTLLLQNVAHAYETVANVTSITFSGSVANSLAVGSYFKVWKIA
jgi:hypothetical protein